VEIAQRVLTEGFVTTNGVQVITRFPSAELFVDNPYR